MTTIKGKTNKPAYGQIIKWRDCPDCEGRGWFLINPFSTGGSNGCGGPGNICQCETCKAEFVKHQKREEAIKEQP